MTNDLVELLDPLKDAARGAGEEILRIVRQGFETEFKADRSPVTIADRAAEAVILRAIAAAAPGVPVIAEEEVAAGREPAHDHEYFLVDPLDGTKEFVRGGTDYTVNIALVRRNQPVLGVVYAPATGKLYSGLLDAEAEVEFGATRHQICVREPGERLVAVASKSHLNRETLDYLEQAVGQCEHISIGSSLKFCLVAEGAADIYPRLAPTCEWDTAAGHAVLLAAGGRVDGLGGRALQYSKPDFLNPAFVATAGWPALPVDQWVTDTKSREAAG